MLSLSSCWTFKLRCPKGICIHGSGAHEKAQDGKNMDMGSCVAVKLGGGCEVLASLLQAWSAPPPMGDCFDLSSQILVDFPCWAYFYNRKAGCYQLEPAMCFSSRLRIGNSGRHWVVWLWSKGHFLFIECLTTLPPSRKSSSLISPTLVAPLYWAQALWKDLLYSLSLEKSKHLREWQSKLPLEKDLREPWTLYWSPPSSELKEVNLYTAWSLPWNLRPSRCSHKQWVVW